MYPQLLRLWLKQKWRDLTWKKVVTELYGYIILLFFCGGAYFGSDGALTSLIGLDSDLSDYALACITSLLFFDLLGKIFIKKEMTVMDDYLRARPVSQGAWNLFLLTANLMDYWTWSFPIAITIFALCAMPLPHALATGITALTASMVNAMAITSTRRADTWYRKVPPITALIAYVIGSFVYGLAATTLLPFGLRMGGYVLFNIVAVAALFAYMTTLHSYDEHVQKARRVRSVNAASTFALDWAALWRPKRMRQSVLLVTLIMVLDAYFVVGTAEEQPGLMFNFILLCAVGMPSMVLAQWTFGVEANFFHGIWTKPVSVESLLINKFRFFAILNTVAALLLVPMAMLGWVGWLKLVAIYVFTIGMANLVCMPTCLFSQRLDLFSSAYFNYQGSSMRLNLYAFVCLVPDAVALALFSLLSEHTACCVLLVLGLIGLSRYRMAIRPLAALFVHRRHARFEAYMKNG